MEFFFNLIWIVVGILIGIALLAMLPMIISSIKEGAQNRSKKNLVNSSKNRIVVLGTSLHGPKSLNGWDVGIEFGNSYSRTLKYVRFNAKFQNQVGDRISSEAGGYTGTTLEFTGPLNPGAIVTANWDNFCFYAGNLYFNLESATVVFMDNTEAECPIGQTAHIIR